MISVLSITKKNNTAGSGMSEAKFIFEFDNASTLPVKIYIQGQTPYFIANDSIAKNVSTNTYYRYNAEETRWVKDVSITSLPSTSVGNVTITDNGAYNILNNEITGYSKVDVDVSGGGGGETTVSTDVQFIDYDGTIIKTYSAEDFATLTQLPENPTHEGLISQGWNWSLEDAKEYVASNGKLIIGQMYITDDGKTRLYVNLIPYYISPTLNWYTPVASEVEVDWGDGSDPVIVTTTADNQLLTHTYATTGDYVIAINVLSGSIQLKSSDSNYGILRAAVGATTTEHREYLRSVFKVEVGRGVTDLNNSFKACSALDSITIPNSVVSIVDSTFRDCFSLSTLIIPQGVTTLGSAICHNCYSLSTLSLSNSVISLGDSMMYSCYSLGDVIIPNSVTDLSGLGTVFSSCYSLKTVTIPNSVTAIGGIFNYCYSLREVNIDNTTGAIPNSPWGATPHCQVNWLRS